MLKHHERKLDNKDRKILEIINEIKFSKTIIFRLSYNKLKLSYVQTILGPFYHYFLPFFQTLIFNFLFNRYSKCKSIGRWSISKFFCFTLQDLLCGITLLQVHSKCLQFI